MRTGREAAAKPKRYNGWRKKKDMGLAPPAQITRQGLVERSGSRNQLVVDGGVVTLFAHVVDELLNHRPIGVANGTWVGHDLEVYCFEILKKNISVERQ